MFNSIQQFETAGIKNLRKAEDEFIRTRDMANFINAIKEVVLHLGLDVIAETLENYDEAIRKSPKRSEKWSVVRKDPKQLVTSLGTVQYRKTLFINKTTKERSYLLDRELSLEKHQRITEDAEAQLLTEAVQTTYRKGGEAVSILDDVSKETVMDKIRTIDFTKVHKAPETLREIPYLYIDADEDHVALQFHEHKGDVRTKDAGYPIGTFVRKQALREKLEVNAHAAIVTKDEYYQAQKAIRNVTPIQYKVGDEFALKGKICCGNCNRQLRHERQYGEMVFYCGYKRSAGKFSKCYGGYYREYSVNAKVARAIKTVFYALDMVNQGMQEKQSITVRCVDIEDLEKQAEAIRVEQIKLYESYADGVLLRDAYIEKKKALSEKLAALQDSIRTEKEEQECADELDEEIRALTKQASEKTYIGGLTKECVDAFVSMVYLYDDQTMKIEFNCEDVIRRALEKYGA